MDTVLTAGDKRFIVKAMRHFNIKAVNIDWSDSKKKWPDIWVYLNETPPRIVVTQEWSKQDKHERRKRLVHEMRHINGERHDELKGYSTYPDRDWSSVLIYNKIIGR